MIYTKVFLGLVIILLVVYYTTVIMHLLDVLYLTNKKNNFRKIMYSFLLLDTPRINYV